jgi:hypothetical protein
MARTWSDGPRKLETASGEYSARAPWGKANITIATTNRVYSSHGDRTTPGVAWSVWYGCVRTSKRQGRIIIRPAAMMMTAEDIRAELGWNDDMIHSLLQPPDSTKARRCKSTGGYTYGLYHRDRVPAAAQSPEGRAAKRRWDETLRGDRPNPGWTTLLIDIGRPLGITAVAVGRILELLGYRSNKHVTDSAVAAGCGVRRWDGYAMHDDWLLERVVSAIGLAARVPGQPGSKLMEVKLEARRSGHGYGYVTKAMHSSQRRTRQAGGGGCDIRATT